VAIARLGVSVALIGLLVPVAAQCQSDQTLWRFVHPNAKALVSINWQRIRQSPAGAMIRDKWLNAGLIAAIPGIELLDEIDRVVISSPGNETPTDTAGEAAKPPLLVVVRGHFDAVRLHRLFTRLGGKAQAYNSFQVYRPQGKDAKDLAYVLFDASTILFGDAPSLFAALDHNQFEPPVQEPGSITARAAEMDAAYEIAWILNMPASMSSDWLAGLFPGADWASEAQRMEAGFNLGSGLTADVTVRFGSEAAAKRVIAEMTKLTAVMSKDKVSKDKVSKDRNAEAQMQEIAKKLKFSSDGPVARIGLRLTPEELEKSAQAIAAAHKESAAVLEPESPKAALAKPGVIRIEGLDEGTREIPLDEKHEEKH
jgi:hypothetical protein